MTLARWNRLTEWPLTLAAAVFLLAYSWSVIGNLNGPANALSEGTMTVTWALFGVDYVVSLILAENRGRWFVRHLHDLAIVALPMLRPLRLLRLIALMSVLQRAAGTAFRGRIIIYTVASAALLVFLAGLAILDAEQNETGANITNFGDALWWAFVTITTVGYGDFYPITLVGRLIAVALMVAGIALIGSVTAAFASWFAEQVAAMTAASKSTNVEHDADEDAFEVSAHQV